MNDTFFKKDTTDIAPLDVDGVTRQGDVGDLANDLKSDRMGRPEATAVHGSNITDEAQHSSAPLNTLGQAEVRATMEKRNAQATQQSHGNFSEEVASIMNAVDPDDDTMYLNSRYFEQQGNRKGFTLYAQLEDNATFPIEFENGIYVTSNIAIVEAILRTIENRRSNVSSHIVEISEARYEGLLQGYRQAERLRTTNGPVTTTVAGASGRALSEVEAENAKLREELATMKANSQAISGSQKSSAFGQKSS